MSFSLGEKVQWTSQGGGSVRVKTGVIVEVVAPFDLPSSDSYPSLHKRSGIGKPRDQRSYVVQVDGGKCYWPRPCLLRRHMCREAEARGRSAWVSLCREMGWEAETRAILLEQFIHGQQLMPQLVAYAKGRAKFALHLPHEPAGEWPEAA